MGDSESLEDFDWSRVSLRLSENPMGILVEGFGNYKKLRGEERLFSRGCPSDTGTTDFKATSILSGYCRLQADDTVARLKAKEQPLPKGIFISQDLPLLGAVYTRNPKMMGGLFTEKKEVSWHWSERGILEVRLKAPKHLAKFGDQLKIVCDETNLNKEDDVVDKVSARDVLVLLRASYGICVKRAVEQSSDSSTPRSNNGTQH